MFANLKSCKNMAWLRDQIGRKTGARNAHYSVRKYFRYESINEVEKKLKNRDISSGLTNIDRDEATAPDYAWCVYGKKVHH